MNKAPKNIEEIRHSATLAEKTVSNTVSSIDQKLSQILALHQNIGQWPIFPSHDTDSYQIGHLLRNIKLTNSRNIRSLILEYHRTAISVRKTIRRSHEIRIYRDHKIIIDKIATDVRKGHTSSHQFACFVTMESIPEIYVQVKTKHVIIATKLSTFQGLVLMAKDRNRNTGSPLALSEVSTK